MVYSCSLFASFDENDDEKAIECEENAVNEERYTFKRLIDRKRSFLLIIFAILIVISLVAANLDLVHEVVDDILLIDSYAVAKVSGQLLKVRNRILRSTVFLSKLGKTNLCKLSFVESRLRLHAKELFVAA